MLQAQLRTWLEVNLLTDITIELLYVVALGDRSKRIYVKQVPSPCTTRLRHGLMAEAALAAIGMRAIAYQHVVTNELIVKISRRTGRTGVRCQVVSRIDHVTTRLGRTSNLTSIVLICKAG